MTLTTPTSAPPSIFIVLVGGYGNIGDAVIRRRALETFRGIGQIEAYVGNAPDAWIEQLGIQPGVDLIYRSGEAGQWLRRMAQAKRPKSLVLDPGEVLLGAKQTPKELGFLAMTFLARASGARVLRMPRAVRQPSRITAMVHRAACRASNLTLWREAASHRLMRTGTLVPDIGFSESMTAETDGSGRRLLVISVRGPRPYPNPTWFDAIDGFATLSNLAVICVSQVREDEDRSRELSERLVNARFEPWGERSDAEQESFVREIYRRSALVISDRLHALVLAALDGAAIAELIPNPSGKIAAHFRAIGEATVSQDSLDADAATMETFLAERLAGRSRLTAHLNEARSALQVELNVARMLAGSPRD